MPTLAPVSRLPRRLTVLAPRLAASTIAPLRRAWEGVSPSNYTTSRSLDSRAPAGAEVPRPTAVSRSPLRPESWDRPTPAVMSRRASSMILTARSRPSCGDESTSWQPPATVATSSSRPSRQQEGPYVAAGAPDGRGSEPPERHGSEPPDRCDSEPPTVETANPPTFDSEPPTLSTGGCDQQAREREARDDLIGVTTSGDRARAPSAADRSARFRRRATWAWPWPSATSRLRSRPEEDDRVPMHVLILAAPAPRPPLVRRAR